jgi:tungstate transport system permease protein
MPEDVSAFHLLLTADPMLLAIVRLSLIVSLSAVLFAAMIGVPAGAALALIRFSGRECLITATNLPP